MKLNQNRCCSKLWKSYLYGICPRLSQLSDGLLLRVNVNRTGWNKKQVSMNQRIRKTWDRVSIPCLLYMRELIASFRQFFMNLIWCCIIRHLQVKLHFVDIFQEPDISSHYRLQTHLKIVFLGSLLHVSESSPNKVRNLF